MKFHKFIAQFASIQDKVPDYRLGQHFINVAIRDRGNPKYSKLWEEKDQIRAMGTIIGIMQEYNWNEIPVLPEAQEWYGE